MSDGHESIEVDPTLTPSSDPGRSTLTAQQRRVMIGSLIGGHLLLSLLLPFFGHHANNEWIYAFVLGICVSQVNLIAAWGALAAGRLLERLPWAMLMGVLMWYALVIGDQLDDNLGISRSDAVELGLIILYGILVTMIPLWIAARVFGWRLTLTLPGVSLADIDTRSN